jgi:predicted permease
MNDDDRRIPRDQSHTRPTRTPRPSRTSRPSRPARPFTGGRADDIEEEIRHHLVEREETLVARGWEPAAARREAERLFGDVRRVRRDLAELRRPAWTRPTLRERSRTVAFEVRYALRGLRRNPTFAGAVVATLALGVGAAASIFAVVDALLLRPMPYQDAERWVTVNQARADGGWSGGLATSRAMAWQRAGAELLDGWIAFTSATIVRTDGAQAEALRVVAVTPGAERLLGLPLLLGRGFTAEDALPGAPPVAVLGRAYWDRLGADPGLVGRTLRFESGPATVVGVLRGGVRFPEYGDDRDLWLPLRDDFTWADRDERGLPDVWARLAPGLELEAAQTRLDALADALAEEQPSERTWKVRLVPVGEHRANPDVKRALWTLTATVGVIFLIALVNGVNLLLVRGSARERETTVRQALGGSRARILRQLLVEGLVLGALGGAAAAALAWVAIAVLRGILPSGVLFFSPHAFTLEARTLLFVTLASLGTGTLLGLVPGLRLLRDSGTARRWAGRPGDDGPHGGRLRTGLVVAQVALSMTLLVGAGLLLNSLLRLVSVDPGYDHERIALASLTLSPTRYPDGPARAELGRRLEQALESRPEISEATIATGSGFTFGSALEPEGADPRGEEFLIPHTEVAEDYFRTTGARLVAGRGLEAPDRELENVVVDRDLARFLWGEQSPLGRRFRVGENGDWMTVVGVVDELRMMGRDQRPGPYQFLRARGEAELGEYLEVAMRTGGRPEALLPLFRETLREIDPEQWIWRLRTGAQALAEEEDTPRFLVTLMTLLAGIAMTLAAVGLYGVLAYSVTRRRRELGIRIALGADHGRVRGMVLRQGLAVAAFGVVLGLVAAWALAGAIESLLYELEPRDPATFAATAALLLAVALVASLLPARRATGVDPAEVLREE